MDASNPVALKQKQFNERREFTLEPNRIRCYTKDLNGEGEVFLDYESLTTTTRKISQQNGTLYTLMISFGIFAAVGFALNLMGISALMRWTPLWLVAAVIFYGFHVFKKRRYLLVDLSNGKSILFLADRPSSEELDNFIRAMYAARKKYLRERYYRIDLTNDPGTERRKIYWLLKEEIITEAEFQEMQESLEMLIDPSRVQYPSTDFNNP